MKKLAVSIVLSLLCAIFLSHTGDAIGAMENGKPAWKLKQKEGEKPYDLSTILVKFTEGVTAGKRKGLASLVRGKIKDKNEDGIDDSFQHILGGRLALINLEGVKGKDLASQALLALQNHPLVEYAEHNYLHSIDVIPNDPDFDEELWGLHNTGQTGGTEDADIDAPEAWDITTGSSEVIVAVIDTGVDYTHIDLIDNMWTNPVEDPGNGVDDDDNGYVDDVHGINAITGSGDPMDDHRHGTHCSGTIGAVGNNNTGVTGVNWDIKIMALKFLGADGYGNDADAIECINYAIAKKNDGVNIRVLSNSWGGGAYNQALYDAIEAAHTAGILFVASAGNNGSNNDSSPHYPSSYTNDNLVAVASTDHNDNRSSFSNYGATSVDLAAPGSSILSTWPGNNYGTESGTSMAAPHVSGVAALMLSENNDLTVSQLKDNLLNTGDLLPALSDLCVSGKRLNAYNSLPPLWLSADPTSKTVTQGETATYTINVESVLGFSELVTLSASSDPPIRATIEFDPADSGYPGFSSYMKVITTTEDTNPNNYTVPGDYLITVAGASNSITKTTAVMLTIKPEGLTTVSYPNDPNPDISIPDCVYPCESSTSHGIIASTIYVPDSLTVWEIASEVNITHPYRGDLGVKLTSPIGTEAILKLPDRTDWADDIHQTYSPTEFMNQNCQGCWKLIVSDEMWDDIGTLNNWTLAIDGVSTDPFNQAPTVTITDPGDDLTDGAPITFTGTAYDYDYEPPDDISGGIEWNSSIDGDFGTGASVTTHLSPGSHIITARAKDSGDRTGCDSITVDVLPVCNNNGNCEAGEDCNNCPGDCISGGGALCGNGICEPSIGEDCQTCDSDCAGKQGGKPSKRFCCGGGDGENLVDCSDPRCTSEGYACSDTPTGPFCCGDYSCEGTEDSYNCEIDCGPPPYCGDGTCDPGEDSCTCPVDCRAAPSAETEVCTDGVDNDCDTFIDCDDSDCDFDPACQCGPKGQPCSDNSECCSNRCRRGVCK